MSRLLRRRPILLAAAIAAMGLAAIVATATGQADPREGDSNMARLAAMPLEHRRRLAAEQRRFESLPRDQQRSIRELDAEIEAAAPEVRDRYREIARRYYNWLQTLPAADREALRTGPTPERLERIHALLAKSSHADRSESLDTALARGSTLNPLSFVDQVHAIRIWLALDAPQRQELERAAPADRLRQLEQMGPTVGVVDQRPDLRRRADELARDWMNGRGPNGPPFGPGSMRRFESLKAQGKGESLRRLAESRMLSRVPADPVAPAELNRLVQALPSWIRQSLDALPPDAADERLRLIYRSLWPSGTMPAKILPWAGTPGATSGPPPQSDGPPPRDTGRPTVPTPPGGAGAPF